MATQKQTTRRTRVIKRLEEQLRSKTKNSGNETIELSEKDTERIKKELEILKSRV